ncbi:hypothetical protein BJ944DRAFT_263491 [Cunninghamella echinulata]|nr:hypothetical protein BJ944DRAFT_263491 [Cunninghamella echinulata]
MDSLPNEILQNTFLFLSPRYRYHCSLVCKAWYLTYQQPLFYQTITIYKYSQFIKFLTLAKTTYINHKPIGHYVRRLHLKDLYNKHILTYEEIEELHHVCPFLTFIDDICMDENDTEQHDLYMIPYWKHLTEIKLWYSRNDTYRLYAAKHGPHLTSLQLDIKDIITINELQMKQQLSITHHYKNKIKNKIKNRINNGQNDKDIYEDDDDEDNKIENNIRIQHDMQPQLQANYQYYYGRVILFPAHHLVHLKELYLCFKSASYRSSVAEYRLDERTLESLHQSCPVLESLSLNYLVLNCLEFLSRSTTTTTSFSATSTSTSLTISPCKSLKHLYLKNCKLYQYGNYNYLSRKYPHLTSLHLNLQWKDNQLTSSSSSSSSSSAASLLIEENDLLLRNRHDNQHHANLNTNAIINSNLLLHMTTNINANNPNSSMHPNHPTYRSMIYEFITGFSYLKELSAEFIYINDFSNVKWQDGLWPGKELLYWLIQHPQQLTFLDYPYDLSTMEYDMKKKKKKKNSNNMAMMMIKKKGIIYKKRNEMNGIIRNGNYNHEDDDFNSDDSDEEDNYYATYYEQYDVFQRRAYLDHLTTLVLNTEEEFSYTLHYLLRDGKRKIASNSIVNLTIKKEKGIMTHFYLFEWLDAFPRLQSLTLSGVGLIDDKEQNAEQQEELMEEDEETQWDHLNYTLKELIISSSSIFLMGGLSMICKVCPSLRVLKLAYVDFFGYLTPLEQTPKLLPYTFLNRIYCIVIDAPHLILDEFSISSVRCGAYWKQFNEAEMTELLVEEVGDTDNDNDNNNKEKDDDDDQEEKEDGNVIDEEGKEKVKKVKAKTNGNIFRILEPSKLKPPTNVVLRCKSVDIVKYSNNH